jgi:aminoglycoside phosphotransferase (APT) family kinase protein
MSAAPADPRLDAFLVRHGLASDRAQARWTPLAGGVSSDIWKVELPDRTLCVKRALPKLKVAQDWQAPISRNAYEWAWISFAAGHRPAAVPFPLAHDPELGIFAMSYLEPDRYPVWKQQLLQGAADVPFAAAVARTLVHLHAASAHDATLAARFDTLDIFHRIRLEPYLLATARRHPALAPALHALAQRTAATRVALVHGDVSPKNILAGPAGPVFLDAECAWYGDPAFDLAFCLNHFLLKGLARPESSGHYLRCYAAFCAAYLEGVTWEAAASLEARAASLLPGLFLARVDGKSPVEYVTTEAQRDRVRATAGPLLQAPPDRLATVAQAWESTLRANG